VSIDLFLRSLPCFRSTDERRQEFLDLLRTYPKEDLIRAAWDIGYDPVADEGEDDVHGAVVAHVIGAFDDVDWSANDVATCKWDGMDYYVVITGGLSCGDDPMESSRQFQIVGIACDMLVGGEKLWALMLRWAREDYAAKQTPGMFVIVTEEGVTCS